MLAFRQILLGISLLLILPLSGMAQSGTPSCGTDEYFNKQAKSNPELLVLKAKAEAQARNRVFGRAHDTTTYFIPVVVHIVHQYGAENLSKFAIIEALRAVSNRFSAQISDTNRIRSPFRKTKGSIRYEFRLATFDPNGNCTDGITRTESKATQEATDDVKSLIIWDPSKYLNIWVVSTILNNFGSDGTILGYANFPWLAGRPEDGIVIRADQFGVKTNTTFTHEAGHYFGLFHTFQGGCSSNATCGSQGDGVCDTPPVDVPNYGCPQNANTCSSDAPNNTVDMIENYMDYSSCQYLFTSGQVDRLIRFIPLRATLFSAQNAINTGVTRDTNTLVCKPIADFTANGKLICAGNTVSFTNNSYNTKVNGSSWTFRGATTLTSTLKNPTIKFDQPGLYTVSLQVTNSAGTDIEVRNSFVRVLPAVAANKAPILDDLEDYNTLEESSFMETSTGPLAKWVLRNDGKASSGSKSFYLNNLDATLGEVFELILPPVDLSTGTTQELSFKLAFAKTAVANIDVLKVYASTNCGASFTLIRQITSSSLASTTDLVSSSFEPRSDQFIQQTVGLTPLLKAKNTIIKLAITNGGGNDVYIDDINYGRATTSSILESKSTKGVTLLAYPNPTSGNVIVTLDGALGASSLEVFNTLGVQLGRINNFSSGNTYSLSELGLNNGGLYFIKAIGTWGSTIVPIRVQP